MMWTSRRNSRCLVISPSLEVIESDTMPDFKSPRTVTKANLCACRHMRRSVVGSTRIATEQTRDLGASGEKGKNRKTLT